MKNKKWMIWAGLIVMLAVVITGSRYALTRPHEMAQEKTKKRVLSNRV